MSPAAQRRRAARSIAQRLLGLLLGLVAVGLVSNPGSASTTATTSGVVAAQSCSTATVLAADPVAVAEIARDAERDFLGQLNDLRRSQGLRSLVWNQVIADPSVDWSETMSTQIPPGGSASDPGWLHHARDTGSDDGVAASQDYVNINSRLVPNWSRLAENVGVGGMRSSCSTTELRSNTDRVVDALHDAFVASAGHYKNMIGDHNQVGIGVHIDDDELWVTVRFANGDLPGSAGQVSAQVVAYIDAVHQVFLGRQAASNEEQHWAPTVEAGDRLALTGTLAASDGWAGQRINELYNTVLGRNADAGGRAYWVDQIRRGLQFEAVAVHFYGSPEYLSRAGGNNRAFVRALYDDLLHRTPDPVGLEYWTRRLQRREISRSTVAIGFFGSVESRTDRASALYRDVFSAVPSSGTTSAWADRLAHAGDIRTAAEMAATSTFWNRVVQ